MLSLILPQIIQFLELLALVVVGAFIVWLVVLGLQRWAIDDKEKKKEPPPPVQRENTRK